MITSQVTAAPKPSVPDLDFPTESKHFGMSSEEYYTATQRQREIERRVRKTKGEIANLERAGLGLESPVYVQKRLVLGKQQRTLAEHCADKKLVRQSKREKAYGVKEQPRALRSFSKWIRKKGTDTRTVGRSVGAKALNYEIVMNGGDISRFVEGSEIDVRVTFAGYGSKKGVELRVRHRLAEQYGGDPERWSHKSGEGWVFDPKDGKIRRAEVHWMEEEDVGMVEFWHKRWRDNEG